LRAFLLLALLHQVYTDSNCTVDPFSLNEKINTSSKLAVFSFGNANVPIWVSYYLLSFIFN